ncbi:MAG TPA: alpha/beta fold hydrolase [Dyella sp.]|uniref:alpha/beta fold hydrolase n=1 Tax=Dyella sp. TaxID=1869338 RepID=UPI002C4C90F3|nr:alpha/beta fold hydrolase [Dyella sp.]HTV85816.1 alpha/beta fold hydrolase [Dyella sp.]
MSVRRSLVLIPGVLCDERLWQAQVEGLAPDVDAHVLQVIEEDAIAAMAESVLARAPESFALAGFSMGGCVALEVVAQAPHRVSSLALMSTSSRGLPQHVRDHYQGVIAELEGGQIDAYLEQAFPGYVAPCNQATPHVRELFFAMGRSLGAVVAARQMRALLSYQGFSGDLSAIRCLTLLMAGQEDQRTPPQIHRDMAGHIPGARLAIVPSAGHFIPLEQPAVVTGHMRCWLKEGSSC